LFEKVPKIQITFSKIFISFFKLTQKYF